jgi:Ni/Co efflux regulator RcnB
MNSLRTLSGLLLAAALAAPALSMAQGRDDRHDDHPAPPRQQHEDHRPQPQPQPQLQEHHDDRAVRGAGPDHDWHKGDRIPASYRDKRHEVRDWKARHLRQPPRGYHWVAVNGDYVLAAVATGVIAELLLSN